MEQTRTLNYVRGVLAASAIGLLAATLAMARVEPIEGLARSCKLPR